MPRTKQFDEQIVLESAMELFWQKGFHGTSMQELIDHLGINRASLYDTYGDKQQLFDRALAHYKKQNQQGLLNILNAGKTIKEGFKNLFQNSIQLVINDPTRKGCFMVNTATSVACDSLQMNILQENQQFIEHSFAEALKRGIANGELQNNLDIKVVSKTLFTFFNGLQVTAKLRPKKAELLASIDTVLELLN